MGRLFHITLIMCTYHKTAYAFPHGSFVTEISMHWHTNTLPASVFLTVCFSFNNTVICRIVFIPTKF